MARNRLAEIDEGRVYEHTADIAELEKLVRIELAADAPRPHELKWMIGRGHRPTCHIIKPGKSVSWPLNKARSEFGPFDMYDLYKKETDEARKAWLYEHIRVEQERYLKRYDYPMAGTGSKPDLTPIGPHRSPDITITLLDAEGGDVVSYRLHEVYGIGEFEEPSIVAGFRQQETPAEINARVQADQDAKDAQIEAMRRELAEMKGMFRGVLAGKELAESEAAKPREKATA